MDKYGFEDQKPLKGKTEAYHFQFYKSELFNNAQKDKLDGLLKSRGIASGIRFIEQLPTASTTKPETAQIVFECFAEAKDISQPECLLEFLKLCHDKNFPLVAFENDRHGLETTIEDLRKHIAESKNKAHIEKNPPVDNGEANAGAIKNPSSNIEPVTGEIKWLDPYNFDEIRLVGREKEIDLLNKFVESEGQFKIWAISGPSGSGKTRLAIEWAIKSPELVDWDRCVLHKEDRAKPEKWAKWSSDKPTLIIIDYMYGFDEVILQLMAHRSEPTAPKIRLLLIDHVFSEPLHSDKRWGLSGHRSSRNQNEKFFFDLKPLDLRRTENQEEIIESIIAHRAGIDGKSSQVFKAREYLQNTQGAYHPLFAALVGDAIKAGKDFTVWNRRELIDYYLSGEDRLPWEHRTTTGRWASHFVAVATARREVIYDDLFMIGSKFESAPEDFVEVQKICQKVIADDSESILSPFEPDILGESFFLKFLQFLKTSPKYQEEFRQVFMVGNEETQTEDAIEFIGFIQRLTRNLLNDDQNHKETQVLWNTLFDFMTPSNFADAEPITWAVTAGLIDIVDAIKDLFPEKETVILLKKVEPAVLYRDTNENYLVGSVAYSMLHFELTHKFTKIIPELFEGMFAFFDRFTANNVYGQTALILASYYEFNNVINALIARKANIEATLPDGRTALIIASGKGQTETIRLLLGKGAEIDTADNDGWAALFYASANGHIETVRLLLDEGANINAIDNGGRTALISAIGGNHFAIVRLLLDKGANIDAVDDNGWTALIWASNKDHTETVRLLLDKGARIDIADNYGCTALFDASGKDHAETVRLLLDKGARTDIANNAGRTALIFASSRGHTKTVRLLLDKGARTDIADNDGLTALFYASANGHIKTVRLLLDEGVNIHAVDNNNRTVLIWASDKGHTETVRLLLDKGANIHAAGNDGRTALIAGSASGYVEVVRLLLDKGAEIDAADDNGWTAHIIASANGHVEMVRLLLDRGAKIDAASKMGSTALIYASNMGYTEMVRLLLDKGARTDITHKDGWTALIWASGKGHTDTVRLLLDRGANIDAAVKVGWTALIWACLKNCIEVVGLLLERKACVDIVDKDGRTALSIAQANGHKEIVRMLVEHGVRN